MSVTPHIVWLASFPKSGNTWFRIFLANLAGQRSTPADINDLNVSVDTCNRDLFEMVTSLDSSLLSHDEIDDLRPQVHAAIAEEVGDSWIRVHDAYTKLQNGEPLFGGNVARVAIYLVRDPRDIATSLAHQNNESIDDTIELITAADGALCGGRKGLARPLRQKLTGWSGHVTSWLDQTDLPVHLIRYEDLLAAPVEFFTGALKFVGRPAAPADVKRAVRHANFSELQRQEKEKGFAECMSRTAPFFRSGRTGGWRHELTAKQIARIERAHAPTMQRLGYPTL
jgi:aryl sulfotransferase